MAIRTRQKQQCLPTRFLYVPGRAGSAYTSYALAGGNSCFHLRNQLGEKGNSQKTVLCIDNQALPLLIRKILLMHAGYAVLTAEAAPAGLQLFASEEVHAVVLHCFRGEIGSGSVARRMKTLKPETPIIMLFGGADQPGDALPVVDVLMRNPESPNILLAKLSEVIDRNHFSVGQTTKG